MSPDWQSAYQAALKEVEPAKVRAACEKARRRINDRALEIGAEMKALEEALQKLFVHQLNVCGDAPR